MIIELNDKEIEILNGFEKSHFCFHDRLNLISKWIFDARGQEDMDREPRIELLSLLNFMHLGASECRKLLRFYANAADSERGRETVGKPAKMLARLIPNVTEKQKEAFAIWWKEHIQIDAEKLKIQSSKLPETFAHVYTMKQANASDPTLGHDRKSLVASCMRYEFEDLPYHPAYVYGSGDFEIVWVENERGELMGRYVASIRGGRYVRGPIYTNTNIAADLLENYANRQFENCADKEKKTWIGSHLLRIEVYEEGFLAPYFDRDAGAYDNGDCLIVSRKNAEMHLTETQGFVGGFEYHCCDCGCGLNEYSIHMTESSDGIYCESCFMEAFAYCEMCDQYEPVNDFFEVRNEQPVCNYCAENNNEVVLCDNSPRFEPHYAHIDETITTECGRVYHVDDEDVFFFRSDVDDAFYDKDDEAQFPVWFDGRMTVEQAIESGDWVQYTRANGQKAFKLKMYLEFRNGEIVNRQIELPFAA